MRRSRPPGRAGRVPTRPGVVARTAVGSQFPSQGAAIDHVGWRAIKLDAKIDEFTARGLDLTTDRRDMTLPNGQIAFLYVEGPNGARIEFVERARDMP